LDTLDYLGDVAIGNSGCNAAFSIVDANLQITYRSDLHVGSPRQKGQFGCSTSGNRKFPIHPRMTGIAPKSILIISEVLQLVA
jgi:hypothetical protein